MKRNDNKNLCKENQDNVKNINKEDTTKYPEFVPSLNNWMTKEQQKKDTKNLKI